MQRNPALLAPLIGVRRKHPTRPASMPAVLRPLSGSDPCDKTCYRGWSLRDDPRLTILHPLSGCCAVRSRSYLSVVLLPQCVETFVSFACFVVLLEFLIGPLRGSVPLVPIRAYPRNRRSFVFSNRFGCPPRRIGRAGNSGDEPNYDCPARLINAEYLAGNPQFAPVSAGNSIFRADTPADAEGCSAFFSPRENTQVLRLITNWKASAGARSEPV